MVGFRPRFNQRHGRREFHRLGRRRRFAEQSPPLPPDDGIEPVHIGHSALTPMATCFQLVPSLIARHGTLPVPPTNR